MLTNKNFLIFSLSLYVIFISFVNAQEKHRIEISSQKCEKWLSTKNSAKIFFTAKNLTKINYTNLMYQVAIKDNDGNIVDKTYLKFGRLKPSGEAFGDIATSGATCEEIRSVQILSTALVSIDGDSVSEKISHLIVDNTFLKFEIKKSVRQASEEEKNAKKFSDATTTLSKLNGEWYSFKWKYGYTLKDGKGYATIVNSPNFKEGQEIVRLAVLSDTSFLGENVYKDGKFYKVKVTLKPDGKLFFEGEKNVNWEMEKIDGKTLSDLKNNSEINEGAAENNKANRASTKNITSVTSNDGRIIKTKRFLITLSCDDYHGVGYQLVKTIFSARENSSYAFTSMMTTPTYMQYCRAGGGELFTDTSILQGAEIVRQDNRSESMIVNYRGKILGIDGGF